MIASVPTAYVDTHRVMDGDTFCYAHSCFLISLSRQKQSDIMTSVKFT